MTTLVTVLAVAAVLLGVAGIFVKSKAGDLPRWYLVGIIVTAIALGAAVVVQQRL